MKETSKIDRDVEQAIGRESDSHWVLSFLFQIGVVVLSESVSFVLKSISFVHQFNASTEAAIKIKFDQSSEETNKIDRDAELRSVDSSVFIATVFQLLCVSGFICEYSNQLNHKNTEVRRVLGVQEMKETNKIDRDVEQAIGREFDSHWVLSFLFQIGLVVLS